MNDTTRPSKGAPDERTDPGTNPEENRVSGGVHYGLGHVELSHDLLRDASVAVAGHAHDDREDEVSLQLNIDGDFASIGLEVEQARGLAEDITTVADEVEAGR